MLLSQNLFHFFAARLFAFLIIAAFQLYCESERRRCRWKVQGKILFRCSEVRMDENVGRIEITVSKKSQKLNGSPVLFLSVYGHPGLD